MNLTPWTNLTSASRKSKLKRSTLKMTTSKWLNRKNLRSRISTNNKLFLVWRINLTSLMLLFKKNLSNLNKLKLIRVSMRNYLVRKLINYRSNWVNRSSMLKKRLETRMIRCYNWSLSLPTLTKTLKMPRINSRFLNSRVIRKSKKFLLITNCFRRTQPSLKKRFVTWAAISKIWHMHS